jgi:hypothetical protein
MKDKLLKWFVYCSFLKLFQFIYLLKAEDQDVGIRNNNFMNCFVQKKNVVTQFEKRINT